MVLLVDDLADQRELYRQYLDFAGYEVAVARDGFEAVDRALHVHPDVIIMDLAMARLDGIAATKRLKRDARTRKIPVIILTAFPEKPVQQRAMEAGASAFLTKPCLPDQLESQIRRMLPTRPAA